MRKTVAFLVLLFVAGATAVAQSEDAGRTVIEEAEPYTPEEFPQWAHDLRRAEIVAIGSVPFTMLASRLLYSIGRYAYFSISDGQSRPEYLPALFAPQGAVPLSSQDNLNIVLGAVGLSLVIALTDYLLGLEPDEPAARTQP